MVGCKMDTINFKEYNQRYEAEMVIELLRKNGVDAILIANDCGGTYPSLGLSAGYRVQIDKNDLDKAKKIID